MDPKQRLVVALMQKKVAEVLQSERFNNHFQIGMLSSFESFLQSVETAKRRSEDEPAFDGEEQHRGLDDRERKGIDTEAIGEVVRSFRETFGSTLPHPKLDTTAKALSDAFETGEKTLVFVRRVATVNELAAKIEESFDAWIRARMEECLPELHEKIAELFEDYARERLRRPDEVESAHEDDADLSSERERIDRRGDLEEDDEGGAESFLCLVLPRKRSVRRSLRVRVSEEPFVVDQSGLRHLVRGRLCCKPPRCRIGRSAGVARSRDG